MKIKLFTLPNILTLCNLLCGAAAAVAALRFDNLQWPLLFIVAAAVFDFLDGFAARLFKSYSPSSAASDVYKRQGYLVFILAAFSALRLAKFNIDENQSTQFIGMPTPAAALLVAASGYLAGTGMYMINPWFAVLLAFVLSYLLVCNVPMFALKFKHYGFRGNEVRYIFAGCAVVALIIWKILAIPFIIMAYVAVSMVLMAVHFRKSE